MTPHPSDVDDSDLSKNLSELRLQAKAMLDYALGQGKRVPSSTVEAVFLEDVNVNIAGAHAKLAKLVAPAKPRSIHYLAQQKNRFWGKFSIPVPLIANMMGVAGLALAGFVWCSLQIDLDLIDDMIWYPSGLDSVYAMFLLMAAAALGASFHALFKANHYVVRGIFDPKYIPSYWIRLVLGIIAGFILAAIVPVEFTDPTMTLTRPILALLGGFSAQAVHEVLRRLVETVMSLVRGSTEDVLEARQQSLEARMTQNAAIQRARLHRRLSKTLRDVREGSGTPEDHLTKLIEELEGDPDLEEDA
jgi:hypothetical protein